MRAFPFDIATLVIRKQLAAGGLRNLLPNGLGHQLDAQLTAVATARRMHDRGELALVAIEAYRVFVSAVATDAKVSAAINLLDSDTTWISQQSPFVGAPQLKRSRSHIASRRVSR